MSWRWSRVRLFEHKRTTTSPQHADCNTNHVIGNHAWPLVAFHCENVYRYLAGLGTQLRGGGTVSGLSGSYTTSRFSCTEKSADK